MKELKIVAGIHAGGAGITKPEITALADLQSIYRDPLQPASVRMRAATIAIAYESPRLAVTAYLSNADDFASRLDKAILRSHPPVIEHRAGEVRDE